MSRSSGPNLATIIILSILGVALVITAVIIVLRGLGVLTSIPGYVIWALALLTIGVGIIAGIQNMRD